MKTFFAAVLLVSTLAVAQAGIDKKEALRLLTKCKQETNAQEDVETVMKTQTIPDSPEGKCMMACVLREKGLMNAEGNIDVKAISDFAEKTFSDDPEKMEHAASIIGKCSTIDVKGLDKCEKVYRLAKCGKEGGFSFN